MEFVFLNAWKFITIIINGLSLQRFMGCLLYLSSGFLSPDLVTVKLIIVTLMHTSKRLCGLASLVVMKREKFQ